MGKAADDNKKMGGEMPAAAETLAPMISEQTMSLAERANLARNLYALHDWLRTHLEP